MRIAIYLVALVFAISTPAFAKKTDAAKEPEQPKASLSEDKGKDPQASGGLSSQQLRSEMVLGAYNPCISGTCYPDRFSPASDSFSSCSDGGAPMPDGSTSCNPKRTETADASTPEKTEH